MLASGKPNHRVTEVAALRRRVAGSLRPLSNDSIIHRTTGSGGHQEMGGRAIHGLIRERQCRISSAGQTPSVPLWVTQKSHARLTVTLF